MGVFRLADNPEKYSAREQKPECPKNGQKYSKNEQKWPQKIKNPQNCRVGLKNYLRGYSM